MVEHLKVTLLISPPFNKLYFWLVYFVLTPVHLQIPNCISKTDCTQRKNNLNIDSIDIQKASDRLIYQKVCEKDFSGFKCKTMATVILVEKDLLRVW